MKNIAAFKVLENESCSKLQDKKTGFEDTEITGTDKENDVAMFKKDKERRPVLIKLSGMNVEYLIL